MYLRALTIIIHSQFFVLILREIDFLGNCFYGAFAMLRAPLRCGTPFGRAKPFAALAHNSNT